MLLGGADPCVGVLNGAVTCTYKYCENELPDCGSATCTNNPQGYTCECSGNLVFENGDCVEPLDEVCAQDQYVSNHTCKDCSVFTRKKAGGLISGEDTSCITKDWVAVTASALGGAVIGVGGVLIWFALN